MSSPQKAGLGACVTIGNFDGVHLGHQSLISLSQKIAAQESLNFQLVTFWPHPRVILKGRDSHSPLTSRSERLRLLAALGVENIRELDFNPGLASLSPEEFVARYLLPWNMKALVVGHDFNLGRGRAGNVDVLADLGQKFGFKVDQAPPFSLDGLPVSSTRLRQRLREGKVREAAAMLGRNHTVGGVVAHGFGRGAGLGFPTANLGKPDALLPANGVYVVRAHCLGEIFKGVANIGLNPTFGNSEISVETFLLDANPDLYDKNLRLEFVDRLRDERKFDSLDALKSQIGRDADQARKILDHA